MARSRRDKLRLKLDRLAESAVDEVLDNASGEITLKEKAGVLRIAGAYWAASRKGDKFEDEPESAWDGYQQKIASIEKLNGRASANGKTDES